MRWHTRGLTSPRIFMVLGGMKAAFLPSSSPGIWRVWRLDSADVDSRVWLASTRTYIAFAVPFLVSTHSGARQAEGLSSSSPEGAVRHLQSARAHTDSNPWWNLVFPLFSKRAKRWNLLFPLFFKFLGQNDFWKIRGNFVPFQKIWVEPAQPKFLEKKRVQPAEPEILEKKRVELN